MKINSVVYEDAGNYSCVSSQFKVVVSPEPPKILQGSDWNAIVNQLVTLTCQLKSRKCNDTITWIDATGQELDAISEIKFSDDLKIYEINSTLIFKAATELDQLNFTCQVTNDDSSLVEMTSIQLNLMLSSHYVATAAICGVLVAVLFLALIAAIYWLFFKETSVTIRTPSTGRTKRPVPTKQIHGKQDDKNGTSQNEVSSEIDYMDTHSHIWENFE